MYNPHNQRWTKIDTNTNLFIDQKADKEPFKGGEEGKVGEINNVVDFERIEKETRQVGCIQMVG